MDLEDYAKLKRVHTDQITRALIDSTGGARTNRSSRLPQPTGRGLVAGVALAALAVVALVIAGVISSGGLSTHHAAAVPAAHTSSLAPSSSTARSPTPTRHVATRLGAHHRSSLTPPPIGRDAVAAPAPIAREAVAAPAPIAPPAAPAPRAVVVTPHHTVIAPHIVTRSAHARTVTEQVAAQRSPTVHTVALAEQSHSGTHHSAGFYPWAYQQALAAVGRHSSTWLSESPYTKYFSAGAHHSSQFYVDLYWYAHDGFYNHGGYLHYRNPYAQVLHWKA